KVVTYNMEERQRVKIVDYVGSKKIEVSKIDEKLKEASAQIRLDSFIDPGLVRKVEGIVRDMLREKGFQFANVTHEIKEVAGGPKLVHITFNMDEGPKVRIRWIDLKIPVTEGPRYKVGTFDVAGNTVIKSDYLKPLFKMAPGEYYGEKRIRKGLEKAREGYGSLGYWEFTGFPDYKFHDDPNPN